MLINYTFADYNLSAFVLVNILSTLLSLIYFVRMYAHNRSVFLRPSMIISVYAFVFFSIPLAIFAHFYEHWMPHPWILPLIIHGPIFLSFLLARFWWATAAEKSYTCLADMPLTNNRTLLTGFAGLTLVAGSMLALYYKGTPWECSPLFAVFNAPNLINLFRKSQAIVYGNIAGDYALSFYLAAILPLLIIYGTALLLKHVKARHVANAAIMLLVFICLFASSMLEGMASRVVYIAVSIATFIFTASRFTLNMRNICALTILLGFASMPWLFISSKTIPTADEAALISSCGYSELLATEQRISGAIAGNTSANTSGTIPSYVVEQKTTPPTSAPSNLSENLFYMAWRFFVVPLDVGTWHIHYAQTEGFFGVSGIPKLAKIMHVAPVHTGNLVGLKYAPLHYGRNDISQDVNASAGFIFRFYSSFGIVMAMLCIAFHMIALDVFLFFMQRFSAFFVALSVTAASLGSWMLIQADLSVTYLSGGLGLMLALVLGFAVLDKWLGPHART